MIMNVNNSYKSIRQLFVLYKYYNISFKYNVSHSYNMIKYSTLSLNTLVSNSSSQVFTNDHNKNYIDDLLQTIDHVIENKYKILCNEISWLDSHVHTARLQLIIDGQFEERTADLASNEHLDELSKLVSHFDRMQAIRLLEHLTIIGGHRVTVAALLGQIGGGVQRMPYAELSRFCNLFRMLPKGTRLLYARDVLRRFEELSTPIRSVDELRDITNLLRDVSYFMSKSLLSRCFRHLVEFAESPTGCQLSDPVSIVNLAYISRRMFYAKSVDDELFEKILR